MRSIIQWLVLICLFMTYGINIGNVHAAGESPIEPEQIDTHNPYPTNNNNLDGVPAYKSNELSIYQRTMNHIRGTRHLKKKRGINDPHYPKKIHIHPRLLSFPAELHIEGLENTLENGYLNIDHITEEILLQLTPQNKQSFIEYLSKQTVKMRYECTDKWHAHPIKYVLPDEINAAAAIALQMAANANYQGFTTILCETPISLIPKLKNGRAKSLLSKEIVANTVVCLMSRVNSENLVYISEISTELIRIYLKYWAGKDVERFDQYLRDLILRINELETNMAKFTPQQFGVLLGSLLAGSLWLCSKLKLADEKRQWMFNSIANLIRAFTPFLGAVPGLGNAAAIVSGSISVGVVGAATIYNYFRTPRNYSNIVHKIQGQIKISALQSVEPTDIESRLRVQEMVSYMDAVINVNGEPA